MNEPRAKVPVEVTAHALRRYVERFPDNCSTDVEERTAQLLARYAKSTFIVTASTFNGNGPASFFLDDDLLLVVDDFKDNQIITVYPPDYGFGPEIDKGIRKQLLKEVLDLQKKIAKADERLTTETEVANHEVMAIEARLATLRAEAELLENTKVTLLAQHDKLRSEKSLLNCRLTETADKLVVSHRYAYKNLATVQTIAKASKTK